MFRETQAWWLNRYLVVFMGAESVFIGVLMLALGANTPARDQMILALAWLGVGVVMPLAFLAWRLRTVVTSERLRVWFAGLPGWNIPLDRVETAEAVRVEPLRDFGGWGFRAGRGFGRVFNVWGEWAVVVTLTDGSKRTVGTQRPEELASAILAGAMGETDPLRAAGPVQSPLGSSKA